MGKPDCGNSRNDFARPHLSWRLPAPKDDADAPNRNPRELRFSPYLGVASKPTREGGDLTATVQGSPFRTLGFLYLRFTYSAVSTPFPRHERHFQSQKAAFESKRSKCWSTRLCIGDLSHFDGVTDRPCNRVADPVDNLFASLLTRGGDGDCSQQRPFGADLGNWPIAEIGRPRSTDHRSGPDRRGFRPGLARRCLVGQTCHGVGTIRRQRRGLPRIRGLGWREPPITPALRSPRFELRHPFGRRGIPRRRSQTRWLRPCSQSQLVRVRQGCRRSLWLGSFG